MLEHIHLIKSPSTLAIMGTPIQRVAALISLQLNHLILIPLIIGPPMWSVRLLSLQTHHQAVMNHLTVQWLESLLHFMSLWSKVIRVSNAAIILFFIY